MTTMPPRTVPFVLLLFAMPHLSADAGKPPKQLYLKINSQLQRPESPKMVLGYVKKGSWHETMRASLKSTFGPTAGSALVTITGVEMPEDPIVWFGDRTASVVAVAAPTFIVVETPAHPAGPVDVRVKDRDSDDDATYLDGFLYTDEDDGAPPPDPTTTTIPDDAPGTTIPGGSPTTDAGTVPPTDGSDSVINLDEWLGSMLVTPEGLNLAPVPQDQHNRTA